MSGNARCCAKGSGCKIRRLHGVSRGRGCLMRGQQASPGTFETLCRPKRSLLSISSGLYLSALFSFGRPRKASRCAPLHGFKKTLAWRPACRGLIRGDGAGQGFGHVGVEQAVEEVFAGFTADRETAGEV